MSEHSSESPPTRSLFPEETFTISQLARELKSVLVGEFWSVWVVGEVQRLRRKGRHVYFELAEKGYGDQIEAKIDAVLWNTDRLRVEKLLDRSGVKLAEGQTLRCRGQVDFYQAFGKIQLIVRDVDPLYSLGVLEQRRRETLAWLEEKGWLELNASRSLATVPLRIGLVTSPGSAAYHDFVSTLQASGIGFEVILAPATVQGRRAERSLSRALTALFYHHRDKKPLDVAVVTRGGGSRSDLAAFDSRHVATAVARFPVPVLTGIGHDIDLSIADRVAHSHFKTPTGVAEFLVARANNAVVRFESLQARLIELSRRKLDRALERISGLSDPRLIVTERIEGAKAGVRKTAQSVAVLARGQLRSEQLHIDRIAERLPSPVLRCFERTTELLQQHHERLAQSSLRLVREADRRIEPLARLCHQLSPERTLERGFSLTLDDEGRALHGVDQLAIGDRVTTRLASGSFDSTVETLESGTRDVLSSLKETEESDSE